MTDTQFMVRVSIFMLGMALFCGAVGALINHALERLAA